jgi:hypothetical protein
MMTHKLWFPLIFWLYIFSSFFIFLTTRYYYITRWIPVLGRTGYFETKRTKFKNVTPPQLATYTFFQNISNFNKISWKCVKFFRKYIIQTLCLKFFLLRYCATFAEKSISSCYQKSLHCLTECCLMKSKLAECHLAKNYFTHCHLIEYHLTKSPFSRKWIWPRKFLPKDRCPKKIKDSFDRNYKLE